MIKYDDISFIQITRKFSFQLWEIW